MNDVIKIRRALVSVWDKSGVGELARGLTDCGVEIVSTGSTAGTIRAADVAVTEVSAVTGFPEILDGRVKTLHPAVHAGILADRAKPAHAEALGALGIEYFDLVVVNLYPFRQTVADPAVDRARAIEMIDVGGPAMARAAAKNHAGVAVVVDPGDYPAVLEELRSLGGVAAQTRQRLAAKAFAHTAAYDADVAAWFAGGDGADFPTQFAPTWRKAQDLRYGENPHQAAAYYVDAEAPWGLGSARQLHGKELSYNNLLDADAAWGAASDFDEPCVAIIKHTNPAGLAVAGSVAAAYPAALAGDPVSAYGGIVAANRPIDEETATQIVQIFTEVVIAPSFTDAALEVLRAKANLRILAVERPVLPGPVRALRSVGGGLLVQAADLGGPETSEWQVATTAKPGETLLAQLRFAWTACKHTKSNAIVLARTAGSGPAVVGVGAGQMSRVDSVRLAVDKARDRVPGAVLASDAFFPFRDGPDAALDAGVAAIIQPGGSVRDAEVIQACDERSVPMILTGRRHFRH